DHPYAIAQMLPVPLEPYPATLLRIQPNAAILAPLHDKVPAIARTKLDRSEQSITVVTKGGNPVTVKFGGYTFRQHEETVTVPRGPGMEPETSTKIVTTPYRYAQVEGNPQVFTVQADKVDAFFAKAGELAEPRVAPFGAADVWTLTIERPGKSPIVL